MIIGAYRDNEVAPDHPLFKVQQKLEEQQISVMKLKLQPLELKDVSQLLMDTLFSTAASVAPLAKLILQKTGGNPYFINIFIKTLHEKKLLIFNFKKSQWNWNLEKIEQEKITDNVIEFLIAKLQQLPSATQKMLNLAACIGNVFDLETLTIISQETALQVWGELALAVNKEMIFLLNYLSTSLLIRIEENNVDLAAIKFSFSMIVCSKQLMI